MVGQRAVKAAVLEAFAARALDGSAGAGARLARWFVPERFAAGEAVFVRRPRALYLVVSGSVFLHYPGAASTVWPHQVLGPGALFGEPALLPEPRCPAERPPPAVAEAASDLRLLVLEPARFPAAARALPGLTAHLETLGRLRAQAGAFLQAATASPPLAGLPAQALVELVAAAAPYRATPAAPPPGLYFLGPGGEAEEGSSSATLVLHLGGGRLPPALAGLRGLGRNATARRGASGASRSTRAHDARPSERPIDRPGDRPGEVADGGEAGPGRRLVALVPLPELRRLFTANSALRRAAGPRALGRRLFASPGQGAPLEVLALAGEHDGTPLGALTHLLARTMGERHRDRVQVIELHRGRPGGRDERVRGRGPEGAPRVRRILLGDGEDAGPALAGALAEARGAFDYVFLDPEPALRARVWPRLEGLVTKLVQLTSDPTAELPPAPPDHCRRVLLALLPESSTAAGGERRFPSVFPRGAVRLPLDLARFAALAPEATTAALTERERLAFERWARAVTDRRVGVALGGGGALGYAHVALLRALAAAGLPIDMVSGVSFGALAGAYYCAEGATGLERLLNSWRSIRRVARLACLSSRFLAAFVHLELGQRRLEALDVPLFPLATDLGSGCPYVVRAGTLGHGVCLSSAAPGIFTGVSEGGRRLVDGGVVSNVPEVVLAAAGADLVVASDVLSELPEGAAPPPPLPFALGRALAEMGPGPRQRDLQRSLFLLLKEGGARDAGAADEVFAPAPLPAELWDFQKGEEIVRKSSDLAEQIAERVKRRYLARREGRA